MSILHRLLVEQGRALSNPDPEKPAPKEAKKKARTFDATQAKPGRPRSASPRYTRSKRVTVPLSLPEYEALHTGALAHGLSISALVRKALFGEIKLPRPHPERPKSVVAVERLENEKPKLDGRTREGKAQRKKHKA